MSRDKLIILGVVALGLLGGLVYRQAKKDESIGQPVASAAELPTVSAPDDVDKISISNGDKGEVVLQKVTDPTGAPSDAGPPMKWVLTKPLEAEASQQTVTDLLANLKSLKVESRVNLKLDDDVRKEKQLDPVHAVHVVAWKGSDKKVDELFGKSGAVGELVILSDKPDVVWAAKGYSSYLYTKEAKDFRKKDILHFEEADASAVEIANAHGAFAFTKADKWAGSLSGKPIPHFEPDKVKDMLRAFESLNADDFGDGKSLAETGLDKPEAKVTFHLKNDKGSSTPELLVGHVSTGTNRWAKRADDDSIYQITSFAADWATSDATKYENVPDGGAPGSGHGKGDAGKK
jgi:hypothetical protein